MNGHEPPKRNGETSNSIFHAKTSAYGNSVTRPAPAIPNRPSVDYGRKPQGKYGHSA